METKQEAAPTSAPEQLTSSAIDKPGRAAVAPWQQVEWSKERVELMRKAITPPTATEVEFAFFLEWCKQTGLNPFLKQAYLIERRAQVNGAWVSKHDPMVAEAGFAARADALPDFRGMKSGVVYAGDEFMIDEEAQTITHRWSVEARAKAGNKVVGAWAHGRREGRVVEITYLTLESRIQSGKEGPTKFWKSDPAGQLRKCARADQYRRLYPNIFAGWYDPAEARDDEVEVNAPPQPRAPNAKTDALKARLGVKTVDAPKTVSATPAPSEPKASPPQRTGAPPIDKIRFGPNKWKPIADATTLELEEARDVAHQQLANAKGTEPWVKSVHEGVTAIDAELQRRSEITDTTEGEAEAEWDARERSNAAPAQPEPGSDG